MSGNGSPAPTPAILVWRWSFVSLVASRCVAPHVLPPTHMCRTYRSRRPVSEWRYHRGIRIAIGQPLDAPGDTQSTPGSQTPARIGARSQPVSECCIPDYSYGLRLMQGPLRCANPIALALRAIVIGIWAVFGAVIARSVVGFEVGLHCDFSYRFNWVYCSRLLSGPRGTTKLRRLQHAYQRLPRAAFV